MALRFYLRDMMFATLVVAVVSRTYLRYSMNSAPGNAAFYLAYCFGAYAFLRQPGKVLFPVLAISAVLFVIALLLPELHSTRSKYLMDVLREQFGW